MSASLDRRPGSPDWEPAAPGTLMAGMAAVMKVGAHPGTYVDSPVQEVRELYASCWIVQGFTDPEEVRAWIEVGTEDATIAADAVDAGHRPGDPWVEQRGPQFEFRERVLRRPSWLRATRNRRRARHEWEQKQRRHRIVEREMAEVAHVIESVGGSPMAVLGLLSSSGDVKPDHVWRAIAELDMQLAAWPDDEPQPFSYWESMVSVIDDAAEACSPGDRQRARAHLLELSAAIRARRSPRP